MALNFIDNRAVRSASGQTLPVIDPADGQPYDYVDHNEPARSYAACGYHVKVHSGHGNYSREELQEAVDHELAGSRLRR